MRNRGIRILMCVIGAMFALVSCGFLLNAASAAPTPKSIADERRQLLELYYLKDVMNRNNPTGEWRMEYPESDGASYVFTHYKGLELDSAKQPHKVMEKVIRPKHNPPILTAADILPTATATRSNTGSIVLKIEFTERGRKAFSKFTKEHVGDCVAAYSEGRFLTAPEVREAVAGGSVEISGFRDLAYAQRLADKINQPTPAPPSQDAGKPRTTRNPEEPLSVSAYTTGLNPAGWWHLTMNPDGEAKLVIDTYPKKIRRIFPIPSAQIDRLKKAVEKEQFFDLKNEYGELVPDSSEEVVRIKWGKRAKTVRILYLHNWTDDPAKLQDSARAIRVFNEIRSWFNDPQAVDLRKYDKVILDAAEK